jgi:NADH dehydrogenase
MLASAGAATGTPRIVIVGGGFAGLFLLRALKGAPARVTLVDRKNHHVFQPLLYQVATAGLAAPDIAAPIRKVVRRQRNAAVLLGEVADLDLAGRRVVLTDGALGYDQLVLAVGMVPDWFGHEAWARHAPGLKDCDDALAIRRRILLAYEAAERERSPERQRPWLCFVVIGGGPTGVELAGALAEIARRTLARDFRSFDPGASRIVLLEAGPRLLPAFDAALAEDARRRLTAMGVEVRTGARVTGVDERGVDVGTERIEARTAIWAAGVRAAPLTERLAAAGVACDGAGRVLVQPDLSVPGHAGLWVIGDAAAVRADGGTGAGTGAGTGESFVPGLAPAAIQMGRHTARNLRRVLAGRPTLPFRYADRGQLATIGRSAAIAQIGRLRLTGLLAWLLWALVHIAWLIGFRNRLAVMFEWAWLYVTHQRSARVMLDEHGERKQPPPDAAPD